VPWSVLMPDGDTKVNMTWDNYVPYSHQHFCRMYLSSTQLTILQQIIQQKAQAQWLLPVLLAVEHCQTTSWYRAFKTHALAEKRLVPYIYSFLLPNKPYP